MLYACILCLSFSGTTAVLVKMLGLPLQIYLLMTAGLIAAALLLLYLPGKLLAGKLGINPGKLERRGKMKPAEWSLMLFLLGALICVRLLLAPAGVVVEGQLCYEKALSWQEGLSGFSAVDFYITLLGMGIGLFGKTYAVFWCNLILQSVGCAFLFLGIRKLAGTIYAVTAVLSVVCLSPFFNSTYSAEPQSLLLLTAGIMLWICAYGMEWIVKHPGNRFSMPAACGNGMISGFFVFMDIRHLGFVLLFVPGYWLLYKKKKRNLKYLAEYGCAVLFGFFLVLLLSALFYGQEGSLSQEITRLTAEWFRFLISDNYTALRHSPTLTEYWRMVPVYLLAFFCLPGYFETVPERGRIWILPLAFFSLTEIAADTALQEQGLQFLIWGVMAGFGITAMLSRCQEEYEWKENPDKEPNRMEPKKPGPGEYLENPLPVPKRHVKREMGYAFEPEPEQMYYEVPVAENDDFDV